MLADISKYDTQRTPLKRLERPEDLTGAVVFFSSSDSDFITGQTLLVDWWQSTSLIGYDPFHNSLIYPQKSIDHIQKYGLY